jgi:hypothetical protein
MKHWIGRQIKADKKNVHEQRQNRDEETKWHGSNQWNVPMSMTSGDLDL